jgi:hypothetical protein
VGHAHGQLPVRTGAEPVWYGLFRHHRWGEPFTRIGEMATLAFIPFALIGFAIIYGGGREELLYWINDPNNHSPWLTEAQLFWRNILSLALFYAVGAVYYRQSVAADTETEPGPKTDKARKTAGWVLVMFILNFTFLAWDFGMMSIPHFHTTVFPLHIILGNLNGGTAYLLVLYVLFHNHVADSTQLTVERLRLLAILLTSFTLLWLYMFWAQFFVFWFGNLPQETGPLWKQMYGHFGPYFWTMMSCVFFIPFLCMISAWFKKKLMPMLVLSLIVIAGVWLNRYLMILTVISDDHTPFLAVYEYALLLGLPAMHFLLILLWARMGTNHVSVDVRNEVTDNG